VLTRIENTILLLDKRVTAYYFHQQAENGKNLQGTIENGQGNISLRTTNENIDHLGF